MIKRMFIIPLLLLVMFPCLAAPSSLPSSSSAVIWRPFAPNEDLYISESINTVLDNWHYNVASYSEVCYGYTDANDNWHFPAFCQLPIFIDAIENSAKVVFFASHSQPGWIGVEAYLDENSCTKAKQYYETHDYPGVAVGTAGSLWTLSVPSSIITDHCHADLIFDVGCYAQNRGLAFWGNEATVVCYPTTGNYTDLVEFLKQELDNYLPALSYTYPVDQDLLDMFPSFHYSLMDAQQVTNTMFTVFGDGDMILGPTLVPFVTRSEIVELNDSILSVVFPLTAPCSGDFHCTIDDPSVASVLGAMTTPEGDINCLLRIASAGDANLTISTAGFVYPLASVMGNIPFNGGTDMVIHMRLDTDPLAGIEDFRVAGDRATILVSGTLNTDCLLLEGSRDISGPFTVLSTITDIHPGRLDIPVSDYHYYRLREVETDGDTLVHGITSPFPGESLPETTDRHVPSVRVEELTGLAGLADKDRTETGHKLAILCPASFWDVSQVYAERWRLAGIPASTFSTEGFWAGTSEPDTFRAHEQACIDSLIAQGYDCFLLVGDASDAKEISAPWPETFGWEERRQELLASTFTPQPEKNIHPAPVRWYDPLIGPDDGVNTPYYLSDWLLLDTDDDGWPDPGLTIGRLPFTDPEQLEIYLYKLTNMLRYGLTDQPPATLALCGDLDHAGDLDGDHAASVLDDHLERLPQGWTCTTLRESDVPDEFDRGMLLSGMWNQQDWNFVVAVASLSSRYKPANFFNAAFSLQGTENRLTHNPFLLLNSCGTADFWWTENDGWRPRAELLLEHPNGAIGIFGPGEGSWQEANRQLGNAFLDELRLHPHQPWGFTAAQAIQACRSGGWRERTNALRTVFLGDPLLDPRAYNPEPDIATSASPVTPTLVDFAIYPNPGNPLIDISFRLEQPAHVEAVVYDLRGRRVRTLTDRSLDAGRHLLRWQGEDDHGHHMPSGTYLCRLLVTGSGGSCRTCSRKLMLVR